MMMMMSIIVREKTAQLITTNLVPQKKPLDFGGNLDNMMLQLWIGVGQCHTPHRRMCYLAFNSNNFVTAAVTEYVLY